jgi:hypothetical protein
MSRQLLGIESVVIEVDLEKLSAALHLRCE